MEMTGGIEVRITGGTPLEVLARITAWGLRASSEPRVYALASQIMELEEQLKAYDKNGNPAPSAASAPAPATPPADSPGPAAGENGPSAAPSEVPASPSPAPAPEAPKEDPAPKPTPGKAPSLEAIRAKGIEAAKKYGQAAVKAILKEFNAENMTALPEDKRAEFLVKLEGLGGGNA